MSAVYEYTLTPQWSLWLALDIWAFGHLGVRIVDCIPLVRRVRYR